jgi:hypothetical protein
LKQPSSEEWEKLIQQFTKEKVVDMLLQMENYKLLRTKSTNVYLTVINWMKREKNNFNHGGNNGKDKRSPSFVSNDEIRQDIKDLYEGREETIFHQ